MVGRLQFQSYCTYLSPLEQATGPQFIPGVAIGLRMVTVPDELVTSFTVVTMYDVC